MVSQSDKINQNPTVVPGQRSYANTTKYVRKVILFGEQKTLSIT